jgi:hypothetical protein
MKKSIFAIICLSLYGFLLAGFPVARANEPTASKEEHSHSEEQHSGKNQKEKDHDEGDHDESGHEEGEESHEEGEEEASASVGPGKAVEAISHDGTKMKLAPAAESRLRVKTQSYAITNKKAALPKTAVVDSLKNSAVFRKNADGWYEFVSVKINSRSDASVTVSSDSFAANENIVVSGAPLLRAALLEASGQGGEGHGH